MDSTIPIADVWAHLANCLLRTSLPLQKTGVCFAKMGCLCSCHEQADSISSIPN